MDANRVVEQISELLADGPSHECEVKRNAGDPAWFTVWVTRSDDDLEIGVVSGDGAEQAIILCEGYVLEGVPIAVASRAVSNIMKGAAEVRVAGFPSLTKTLRVSVGESTFESRRWNSGDLEAWERALLG